MSKTARQKAKRKAIIYRVLAIFFLLMQLSVYMGELLNPESQNMSGGVLTGYIIGISLFLYVSLIFFYLYYKAAKTARTIVSEEDLEGIGQN
ncbi:hypothetical protein OGH69_14275 [Flavobacterium sp. MFBS3-15]|uniref:hypothetical protein n=1 Tax=Flavobacterium sp. MFBS3-15 TaxID=2989816 RepID=UPI002236861B|nr:hypothetical protein [Flavobacterium sp. MFBS3-15]MCW4470140.1 hypothetical protein [Flavobacterium sp. MFBS3-15]